MLAVLFLLPALSLAGIPPLSGFIGKLALVEAGIGSEDYAIVAVSLLVSLLTLFVMVKIWSGVFWSPADRTVGPTEPPPVPTNRFGGPLLMVAPTVTLVVCGLACAAFAGPLYVLSERTARDLLAPRAYINVVLDR